MTDYYAILGVSNTATAAEMKAAFRKLSIQFHPDKNGGEDHLFKLVSEAYDVLSDPAKRAAYDKTRNVRTMPAAAPAPAAGAAQFIRPDGSVDLIGLGGRLLTPQVVQAFEPALEKLAAARGINPRAATVLQVAEALGMLPKKRGRRRAS